MVKQIKNIVLNNPIKSILAIGLLSVLAIIGTNFSVSNNELVRLEQSQKMFANSELKNGDLSYWGTYWEVSSTQATTSGMSEHTCLLAVQMELECLDGVLTLVTIDLKAAVERLQSNLKDQVFYLEEQEKLHGELAVLFDVKGDQITKDWNDALHYCEDKNIEKCNELRESIKSFKLAVSNNVKSTQKAAEKFLSDRK